ncbi:MAG: phosphoglucosamine mutase [Defluviitaleaceae bacterium]|nr:phosphoglucosamine mutase [Defluviitaleaceae bacterium]
MEKLFGTDGVRGLANVDLTPELAYKLGRLGAYVLTKDATKTTVLIAKDSRKSGDMLEAALTAGLCSIGAKVVQVGVIPSPAVAYLVKKHKLDAGVIISASHNPMPDNGIKFFNKNGFKLPDALEEEIQNLKEKTDKHGDDLPRPTGENIGSVISLASAEEDYISFLLSTVPNLNLSGMKIVIDCANGATSYIAPEVFKRLGAELIILHNKPNGTNINENCGSTHMESLADCVKSECAEIGIAFDGDGDRMLAVCDKGNEIDGDGIMAVCGIDMNERGKLKDNTIVATVMSNKGFECFCESNNMKMLRANVGDRYVLEKMLAKNYSLGGEQSGHVIFLEHSTTGDGILTALQLLDAIARKKQPLSALVGAMKIFPQVLVNVKIPNSRKSELLSHPEIVKTHAEIESILKNEGRILLRPSGTEPLVRVMIEGSDESEIKALAEKLADVIEKNLSD